MTYAHHLLELPDATLYYETRGEGPVLVLIPGAGGDAGVYTEVAELLADSYTVVTYDRRGNSRSTLRHPLEELTLTRQSADVCRLIDAVGGGPARVVGSGAGAVVALDLVARQPDYVDRMIAHDPGVLDVLPDVAAMRDRADAMMRAFLRDGPRAAVDRLLSAVGTALPPDLAARLTGNPELTFVHETRMIVDSVTDIPGLSAAAARFVIAVGCDQPNSHPYRAGRVIAERTGARLVEVPGDHWSFLKQPETFAGMVVELFAA
ncbi:alpha/beta fold hydrolase [Nocardia arthritidis]|uniref:Alpha/beta fold hydrolase n=1 Tax=Nocardia arthritidis TaxID=228602 RepID=A0A6G9YAJ8_9NOCA|nr:alpha/beta hydrolase [Nocardia arthritidis]QIS10188.1 alpha/beta fold hydrolase [Nocardia arthritidis]